MSAADERRGTVRWEAFDRDGLPVPVEDRYRGPALVRRAALVRDDAGHEHAVDRPVAALCRCGFSGTAPFCDSTHKRLPGGVSRSS